MKLIYIIILYFSLLFSVEFNIQPYLQNATPYSINIMWETNSGSQSLVHYGVDMNLDFNANGDSFVSQGSNMIHDVYLGDLIPNTRYYYQVITLDAVSEIYDFITPPLQDSENSFKLIAMSDMQRDSSNPNKFDEIIHDGVIDYISEQYSDDIAEELAMVLVPGDLVVTGNSYYQWQDHFFEPSADLFSYVPLYPVFGNHEANTNYFTKYFHLPENGTPGNEEHWYYTDYSNLRVIGLDSNTGYGYFDENAQLIWLESVLEDACSNDNIDFVFAQLHHPHKSELWTPGENNYTGEVIERMESFTSECEKPSIHFFGHTHGYSRGQSLDHNHLWVNVATAGGAIDYWGEWPQADYDEFTVSQDEWGFVVVNVEAGDDPQFTLTRVSRGNEDVYRDNEIRDEVVIRFNNIPPNQPIGLSPTDSENPDDVILLSAENFSDDDGDEALAAHWIVYENCDFSSDPVINELVNMENWYYNENTQESVELTLLSVSGFSGNSSYCWMVRYRDTSLGWSEWSEPLSFETGESQYSDNLLINPGAEQDILGWNITEGYMESLEEYVCDGVQPYSGDYYFIVGALCNTATYAEAYQEVDISEYSECIDQNSAYVNYGGYLSDWGGQDYPEMAIIFLDESGSEIDRTDNIGTYNSFWTYFSNEYQIPVDSRVIQMILMGTRYAGDDNDSYFDELFLKIWQDENCLNLLGDLNDDTNINILDVIILVNIILGEEPDSYELYVGDVNEDGLINILDIILIVNIILNR